MGTFTIVGAGYMGTAMAWPLIDNGHAVNLVGTHLDQEIIQSCQKTGYHSRLKRQLPEGVQPFFIEQLENALDGAECIIGGINSNGLRWFGQTIGPHLQEGQSILTVTKGLEVTASGEVLILPEILYTELPENIRDQVYRVAIGGPCIAGELAGRRQTSIVFGSFHQEVAEKLKKQIQTHYYHIKTTSDLLSLEICAALKNAYAMAVGFSLGWLDQQSEPDESNAMAHNMEAAIFATAIGEMERFLEMLGANPHYASGLPGAGDLFVTCQGGRSSKAGRLLGAGIKQADLQTHMPGVTLESVDVVKEIGKSFPALVSRYEVPPESFPLMSALINVIVNKQSPQVVFEAFYPQNQPEMY